MKSMDILTLVFIIALSMGGGYIGAKKKHLKDIERLKIEQSEIIEKLEIEAIGRAKRLQLSIDSLQALPAKVDTVVVTVTRVEQKTDTLILISKDILLNTDTIKQEVRRLQNETKREG